MSYLLKKADALTVDYIKTMHTLIKVKPGTCRYNYMCHANAVHDAWIKKQPRIAMVVYFDSGSPICHFINEDRAGQLIDNTLGYWAQTVDYYFIRWISAAEYQDVFKIHTEYKKILKRRLPWHLRWFSGFTV